MSGRYERDMRTDAIIKKKLSILPNVVTDYYYSLLSSGKSYRTAQTYIDHLDKFIKFTFSYNCPDDFYLQIKAVHINKYISSLRSNEKRISDSYKTGAWTSLNSFCQFLVPEYISINPVSHTKRPKMKDDASVTYLTEEEIAKVLDNVVKKANARMVNRDLCILKIGFAIGLRVSEIIQIDMSDVDLANGKIYVVGKGDRNYSVLVGDKLKHQILLWMQDRETYFGHISSNALFVAQSGNRISPRSVKDLIDKYTDVVDKHVTPHVMRHSCATNLYEKTGDIYLCAGQLHHKNVTTTQRYAELSDKKQKMAANILDDMI